MTIPIKIPITRIYMKPQNTTEDRSNHNEWKQCWKCYNSQPQITIYCYSDLKKKHLGIDIKTDGFTNGAE